MGSHKKHKRQPSSSDTSDDNSRKRRKEKHRHSKKRLTKRKRSSNSESSTRTDAEEERRKERKKLKKQKTLKRRKKTRETSTDIPLDLMEKSKAMAPMTKEEWEKRQSIVRRVYDETTGRQRLIKGDGEIIEEIVSRERHKAINQQGTRGDGAYFQAQILKNTV